MAEQEKKNEFFDKVKGGLAKFFSGLKNFFVKTGRVNSTNHFGVIENIGDFLVYDDHALISAVGMDDVVFKRENVLSASFQGLGKIRRKGSSEKATVKYSIVLDDNVVFPEKVREKNDVKNLTATIFVEKDRSHLLGNGMIRQGAGAHGHDILADCDVYGYDKCLVIVLKKTRVVGEKTEKYEESLLYGFDNIVKIFQDVDGSYRVVFKDNSTLLCTPANDDARKYFTELNSNI